jgi:hypothetical protein
LQITGCEFSGVQTLPAMAVGYTKSGGGFPGEFAKFCTVGQSESFL